MKAGTVVAIFLTLGLGGISSAIICDSTPDYFATYDSIANLPRDVPPAGYKIYGDGKKFAYAPPDWIKNWGYVHDYKDSACDAVQAAWLYFERNRKARRLPAPPEPGHLTLLTGNLCDPKEKN